MPTSYKYLEENSLWDSCSASCSFYILGYIFIYWILVGLVMAAHFNVTFEEWDIRH